jgi:hypothetical protein
MDLIENSSVNSDLQHHPWELARFKIIKENVTNILDDLNKHESSKKILIDIGCGDAFVVKKLSNELTFDEIFAVDINFTPENILKLKKDNNKIQYFQHINELHINSSNSYVILLNDVLEHIEKPEEFLVELNTIFHITASFNAFITVPAFGFLFSQHDIDLGHYRRYNLNQLKQYSSILNTPLIRSGYFFTSLFLIRWVLSLIEKIKPKSNSEKIGVSQWEGGEITTNIFTKLLWIDYIIGKIFRLLKINLPGLSAFILLKRKP